MLLPPQRLRRDLPDALTGYQELLTDFIQRLGGNRLYNLRGFGIGSSFGLPQLCIQALTSFQGTPIRVRSNSARRRSSSSRASGDQGSSPLARSSDCDPQAAAVHLRMTPVLIEFHTPQALRSGLRIRTPSPQRGEGWGEGAPAERYLLRTVSNGGCRNGGVLTATPAPLTPPSPQRGEGERDS
jgi:hypothetical protein